jgi:hypothetical protein
VTAAKSKQLQRTLIFSKNGAEKRYILSNADYLALLRAVEFEGPPKVAVAWTLLQRFALLYPQYSKLDAFIQAYAQPINPKWFTNGKLHMAYAAKLRSEGKAKEANFEDDQAVKRERKAVVPMDQISKDTKNVVDGVFVTNISPVPGSIHYHAPLVTSDASAASSARAAFAKKRDYQVIDYGPLLTSNWFYGTTQSRGFSVFALFEDLSALGSALMALAYTSSVLYMTYSLARRFLA